MWFNYNTLSYDAPNVPIASNEIYSQNVAIAYCRVSTGEQKKNHGVQGQLAACKEEAKKEGLEIDATFYDEAISWKTISRPWLSQCHTFIDEYNKSHKNKIRYLLCTEISRISRPDYIDEGLTIMK